MQSFLTQKTTPINFTLKATSIPPMVHQRRGANPRISEILGRIEQIFNVQDVGVRQVVEPFFFTKYFAGNLKKRKSLTFVGNFPRKLTIKKTYYDYVFFYQYVFFIVKSEKIKTAPIRLKLSKKMRLGESFRMVPLIYNIRGSSSNRLRVHLQVHLVRPKTRV